MINRNQSGMETKMHITLTGNLGSGKSTLSKLLETEYGYEVFSTGKVIRQIAEEHGVSVLEMNRLMEEDHQYDHMIDDTTARIARENPEKNILFDSRLAWNFVESSFKVFLSVSLAVAAERVMGDNRGDVEVYASLEDAKTQLAERAATEDRRYRDIYGIEYFDYSNYNLILDSTDCPAELLAQILMEEAAAYEKAVKEGKNVPKTRLILSVQRPKTDFAQEKAAGTVTRQIFHGVEFEVITL